MPNLKSELDYKQYLQSEHWKDFRKRYWASNAEKACHFCKSTEHLALHHKYGYRRMYEENQNHIVLLCSKHHRQLHELAGWRLDYKSLYSAYCKLRHQFKKQRQREIL